MSASRIGRIALGILCGMIGVFLVIWGPLLIVGSRPGLDAPDLGSIAAGIGLIVGGAMNLLGVGLLFAAMLVLRSSVTAAPLAEGPSPKRPRAARVFGFVMSVVLVLPTCYVASLFTQEAWNAERIATEVDMETLRMPLDSPSVAYVFAVVLLDWEGDRLERLSTVPLDELRSLRENILRQTGQRTNRATFTHGAAATQVHIQNELGSGTLHITRDSESGKVTSAQFIQDE